jgi:hypothetical protein
MNKLEELNDLLKSGAIDENEYKSIKEKLGFESDISNKGEELQSEKIDASTKADVEKDDSIEESVPEPVPEPESVPDPDPEPVQVESVEKEETLQEATKVTQEETASSGSNKISKTGLIVTFLIVGAIGIIGFLNQEMLLGYFSNTVATDTAADKLDNYQIESNNIKKSNPSGIINDPDGYTNVRADKSSSSSVIYEIYDENKRFEIIDDSGAWWEIKFDIDEYPYEIIGFIHNSRVELIDNDEDFLIAKNGFINANNLNFRSTPEINNQNIISYLQHGTNVNILSSVNKTLANIKHCITEKDITVNIDGVKTAILSGKMLDILSTKDSYIVCGYEQKNGKFNKFYVNYSDVDIIRQEKWYKIEVDNKTGFVYQKFVAFNK